MHDNGNVYDNVIESLSKVDRSTVSRLVLLVVSLINTVANMAGFYQQFSVDPAIVDLISVAFVMGMSLWCYWKNNSWTQGARVGDAVLHAMAANDLTMEDITDLMKRASAARNRSIMLEDGDPYSDDDPYNDQSPH